MSLFIHPMTRKSKPKFTGKQQAFINHYLIHLNATEAARRAKYGGSDETLRAIGYENLTKPHIRAEIQRRMKALHMQADEVLMRLADEAGGDIGDCIDFDEEGRWTLNLVRAKELGKTRLIKKLSYNQYGPVIELHDAQAAKIAIGKHLGLFAERLIIEGGLSAEFVNQVIRALQGAEADPEVVFRRLVEQAEERARIRTGG